MWDIPERPLDPPTPEAYASCDNCGEDIFGDYYRLEDFVYCEECMEYFCENSRKAPKFIQARFLDLMDEYKVVGGSDE